MSKDKESIQVTIRVRPLSERQLEEDSRSCLRADQSSNLISMSALNSEKQTKDFFFDSVCDCISQEQIFERVGTRSTQYCMQGYNCTIFAYGQTGAGKTFTMMGVNPENRNYHELRGLVPRTLEHLFQCIEDQINQTGVDYMIKCSFVEIYNQQIIDLLGSGTNTLNIRQDLKKGVYIEGVTEQLISRSEEAMEILRKGSKGRHVGSTFYNQASSRSHSVFTMQIESQKVSNGVKSTKSRHFHFIDLAGSERTKKSAGQRLREGCSINKSLHVLSAVIGSLAEASEGKSRHINYRDSKLTFLLKDSLGGNSKTHLIANISPSWISAHETRSTLIFARKVKLIKVNKALINEDSSGNLESLKTQIKRLKSEIILLKSGSIPGQLSLNDNKNQSIPNRGMNQNIQKLAGTNNKMVVVLQQYVDEQLDKQTKMQEQFNKIISKNEHLQRGILHYSDTQKQLRMIIAIYQNKLSRLQQKLNKKWLQKFYNELTDEQQNKEIKQFIQIEREQFLKQISEHKKINQSTVLIKNLLRELKIYKESNPENKDLEDKQKSLVQLLHKNNQFLKNIKQCIEDIEPVAENGQTSKQIIKEHKELTEKYREMSQNMEKQYIKVVEAEDKIVQSEEKIDELETLLKESVNSNIDLETRLNEATSQKQQLQSLKNRQIQQKNNKISIIIRQKDSLQKSYRSLQMQLSQSQFEKQQIKSECKKWIQKYQFQQKSYQEKINKFEENQNRLNFELNQKIEEVKKLRNENIELRSENNQLKSEMDQMKVSYDENMAENSEKNSQLSRYIQSLQNQKSELKNKIETLRANFEEESKAKDYKLAAQANKNATLSAVNEQLEQNYAKQQHKNKSLSQKLDFELSAFENQKKKWEQNNKQLISMINQKEQSDSDAQNKLKQTQLQIIDLHEKIANFETMNNKLQEKYKQEKQSLSFKIAESEENLIHRIKAYEQINSENIKNRQQLFELTEKYNHEKRIRQNTEEQISQKNHIIERMNEELQRIKNHEKELKIQTNEQKNQLYASKKNYQIQLQAYKQKNKLIQQEHTVRQKQFTRMKQNYQSQIKQLHQKIDREQQLAKINEQSIKNVMETHLVNKEKKISEINDALDHTCMILEARQKELGEVREECSVKLMENGELRKQLESVNTKLMEVNRVLKQTEQQLVIAQNNNIKTLQDMQNNYTEQIDAKNAQIIKYQMICDQTDKKIENLEQQNIKLSQTIKELKQQNNRLFKNNQQLHKQQLLIKQQIHTRQQTASIKIHELTKQNQLLIVNCQKLEQVKKQKQAQFCDTRVEIQQTIRSKQNEKIDLLRQLDVLQETNENMKRQIQDKLMIIMEKQAQITERQLQFQEKQGIIKNIQAQIMEYKAKQFILNSQLQQLKQNGHKMCLDLEDREKVNNELNKSLSQLQKQYVILTQKYQQSIQQIQSVNNNYQILESQLEQVKVLNTKYTNQLALKQQKNQQLKNQLLLFEEQRNASSSEKQEMIQAISSKCRQLESQLQSKENRILELISQNQQNQQKQKYVRIEMQKSQQQIQSMNKKFENMMIQNHNSVQQLKCNLSQQILHLDQEKQRLDTLYEEQKQQKINIQHQLQVCRQQLHQKQTDNIDLKDNIQHLEKQFLSSQDNIKQLNEVIMQYTNELKENVQMKEQLTNKFGALKFNYDKICREKEQNMKVLTTEIQELHKQLKAIMNEAEAWKHRTENLENEVRLSNERADKFRKEFHKQKQANSNLKNLIQNSQGQINQYKLEVEQKELQYKKLLQKLARYDTQRKGLATQDRKVSQLLEKSRLQVSQYKKKYQDQIKINKILKQQLQKKDVDGSIIRERAEEYCKKQNQVTKSIQSDYDKLQKQFNINKQALHAANLKIDDLEEKYNALTSQCREVNDINSELKRQALKNGMDDKQNSYINRMKEEISQLRRQLQKAKQQLFVETQEKIKIKSEMKLSRDDNSTGPLELSKKNSQIKFLQKIIDDCMLALGIRDHKKLSSESLKFAINELQREKSKCSAENQQLRHQLQIKQDKLQILEKHRLRTNNPSQQKDEEDKDLMAKYKAKIQKSSSTFQAMRQSKQEDKSILQLKDSNKHWMSKY